MLGKNCRQWTILSMVVALGLLPVCRASAVAAPPALPKFSEVNKAVLAYFDTQKNYRAGDVISRSQVEAVLDTLAELGWQVAGQTEILDAVLPDSDMLVRELRTPEGRKFARRVAKIPAGYNRLDRLSRLPRGTENVRNLVRGPDGHLMIAYMATTPYGANLGTMLSKAPGGKGFNKSTGRIYTADMLVDRLRREYEKATAPAKPTQNAR
jgi:hypothetical protein